MNKVIYRKLQEVARNQKTVTYGEVGALIGTDMDNIAERQEMEAMLGEISEHEYDNGRPLLSIVVVHKDDGFPGKGIFTFAEELGAKKKSEDDITFFANELNRVHQHWKP